MPANRGVQPVANSQLPVFVCVALGTITVQLVFHVLNGQANAAIAIGMISGSAVTILINWLNQHR